MPSEVDPNVRYRLERRIGEGAMAFAFFALREAPDGIAPVVVKITRPTFLAAAADAAELVVRKEAVALGRLNERVPPTPFVVRLVEAGRVLLSTDAPALPWLAVEYVHGGTEGTTLRERVAFSVEATGYAFSPSRTAHALRCLSLGMEAMHDVGVIHRDLTPNNVLCCGFGEAELFKISDFGIARPVGITATFEQGMLGTPGYAPPEQAFPDRVEVRAYTDVFALAALVFFMLTGEHYFLAKNMPHSLMLVRDPSRRKLVDVATLCPELRERPEACESIDRVLAAATAYDVARRPATARDFAAQLRPWLSESVDDARPSLRLVEGLLSSRRDGSGGFHWIVRRAPNEHHVLRGVAFNGAGQALACSPGGLEYWSGTEWRAVPASATPFRTPIEFVRAEAGGGFIVGTSRLLSRIDGQGSSEVVAPPTGVDALTLADGRLDDLLVALGTSPDGTPVLGALAARRWLKPFPVRGAAMLTSVARVSDTAWVVTGRGVEGGGLSLFYLPLEFEARPIVDAANAPLVAAAAEPSREIALLVGRHGTTVRVERGHVERATVEGAPDLASAALDVFDREWAGAAGSLFTREPDRGAPWKRAWHDPAFTAPFIGIHAEGGRVVAITVDGAVVEGREA